jgi:cyanophycinase
MGFILLEGGAEFGGQMELPDRQAISLAGGPNVRISIIPAAAAPDNNHRRAATNGVTWFQDLGATCVKALPLIDRASADDPVLAEILSHTKLIYLLGGFPQYLGATLAGSLCWQAMLQAYHAGAVIAGSSAGAMVLCEKYYDPADSQVLMGLGLIDGICLLPHHDTFGKDWVPHLSHLHPDIILVGIDEETGIIGDVSRMRWQILGKGSLTLYRGDRIEKYVAGQMVVLDGLLPKSV